MLQSNIYGLECCWIVVDCFEFPVSIVPFSNNVKIKVLHCKPYNSIQKIMDSGKKKNLTIATA